MYKIAILENADELLRAADNQGREEGDDFPYLGRATIRFNWTNGTVVLGAPNPSVRLSEEVTAEDVLKALAAQANLDIQIMC